MRQFALLFITCSVLISVGALSSASCSKQGDQPKSRDDAPKPADPNSRPLGYDERFLPLPEADTIANWPFADSLFIKDGELWTYNPVSQYQTQLTRADSQIVEFFLSPNRKYVACILAVGFENEPGIWDEDETIPQRAVYDFLVINLSNNSSIRPLKYLAGTFIYFEEWISESRFLATTSTGFDISSYYVYDAFRDTLQEVYYGYPKRRQ